MIEVMFSLPTYNFKPVIMFSYTLEIEQIEGARAFESMFENKTKRSIYPAIHLFSGSGCSESAS